MRHANYAVHVFQYFKMNKLLSLRFEMSHTLNLIQL